MTHWSKTTGTGLLIASYLVQSAMILWGPPPVKAAGIAFAAYPFMDPFIFSVGAALGAGIGHSGEKVDVFTGVISQFDDDECDPFHPDWAQRCLGVPSPF